MLCKIQKVGCQAFSDLFCSLEHHNWNSNKWGADDADPVGRFAKGCGWGSAHKQQAGFTVANLYHTLEDPSWTKFIFVREPLERFLSGWSSKCVEGKGDDDGPIVCKGVFGSPRISFKKAVRILTSMDPIRSAAGKGPLDHFALQSTFCMNTATDKRYRIVQLQSETASKEVAHMLNLVGIDNPNDVPGYRFNFGSAMLTPSSNSTHTTNAAADVKSFYHAQPPVLLKKLLTHYSPDYKAFNIAVPRWAVDHVGRAFVKSLGLRFAKH